MIYTERKITIKNDRATIDSPIILFRGDREVEIMFTIVDSKFKFESNKGNVIDKTQAAFGQLAVALPNGANLFTEIAECENGVVVFSITGDMIDEIHEVGFYSFHIRLYNDDLSSRITLPPVIEGIEVREPLAIEDDTAPLIGYGAVDVATILTDNESFLDEDGKLNIVWKKGDIISSTKMNQLVTYINENAVEGPIGPEGPEGPKGDAFTYDMFTEEQLEGLKGPMGPIGSEGPIGPKGDAFTYDMFTEEQLEGLKGPMGPIGSEGPEGPKGPKGDAFTYDMFTEEQLEGLRGPEGLPGPEGPKGDDGYTPIKGVDYFTEDDINSLKLNILGDTSLPTEDQTITGAINELFQNVDSGKQLIADAIDNESITGDSSFEAMSNAINELKMNSGNNLGEVKVLACGYNHAILIKNDGTAYSAGYNNRGQLGLNDTVDRNVFTRIPNITDAVLAGCGGSHSMIVTSDGSVWSAGINSSGQLGDGTTADSHVFKKIDTSMIIGNIIKIQCSSAGCNFILDDAGELYGCGPTYYGQLGMQADSGYYTSLHRLSTTNPDNKHIKNVVDVSLNNENSIVTLNDGTVWIAGNNDCGQWGLGVSDYDRNTVYEELAIDDIKEAIAGDTTVILKNDGTVWVCGYNGYGQLGLGDTSDVNTFTKIPDITNAEKIFVNPSRSIWIILNDGTVLASGQNSKGQLGLNHTDYVKTFTPIPLVGDDIQYICGGMGYNMVVNKDNTRLCCGDNQYGQLGLGNNDNVLEFTPINMLDSYTTKIEGLEEIATSDRDLLYTILSENGMPANPTDSLSTLLTTVDTYGINPCGVKQIACGSHHMYILKDDDTIWVCGDNQYGQLGIGYTSASQPALMKLTNSALTDIKKIVCGFDFTFMLKNDGSLLACGNNSHGQLGLGSSNISSAITSFNSVTENINNDVADIYCGGQHTFIIKNDGTVWSCGYNGYGQLGLGDNEDRYVFTKVTTNTDGVIDIACGRNHTLVVKIQYVYSCGDNQYGQLGLGDNDSRNVLTQATSGYETRSRVFTKYDSSWSLGVPTATYPSPSVYVTGLNDYGQLGLSDTENRNTFSFCGSNSTDIADMQFGSRHTLALRNKIVFFTGYNEDYRAGSQYNYSQATHLSTVYHGSTKVQHYGCGDDFTVLALVNGIILVTGRNDYGQLAQGSTSTSPENKVVVPRGF